MSPLHTHTHIIILGPVPRPLPPALVRGRHPQRPNPRRRFEGAGCRLDAAPHECGPQGKHVCVCGLFVVGTSIMYTYVYSSVYIYSCIKDSYIQNITHIILTYYTHPHTHTHKNTTQHNTEQARPGAGGRARRHLAGAGRGGYGGVYMALYL